MFLLFFKTSLYCKKLDKIGLQSTKKHLQFNDILSADQDSSEEQKMQSHDINQGHPFTLAAPLSIAH